MNTQTANEYNTRLSNFEKFIVSHYRNDNINLDRFVEGLREGKFDIYETLGDYCIYLQNSNLHTSTLNNVLLQPKIFLNSMILI
jgi:hypothetical protein